MLLYIYICMCYKTMCDYRKAKINLHFTNERTQSLPDIILEGKRERERDTVNGETI